MTQTHFTTGWTSAQFPPWLKTAGRSPRSTKRPAIAGSMDVVPGQGVGRAANAMSFDNSALRNFAELRASCSCSNRKPARSPITLRRRRCHSIICSSKRPGSRTISTAKIRNGEHDSGFVRGAGDYNDFTLAQLDEISDVLVLEPCARRPK